MNTYRVLLPHWLRRGSTHDVEAATSFEAAKTVMRVYNLRSTRDLGVNLIAVDGRPVDPSQNAWRV
jgi:hypothetical protein